MMSIKSEILEMFKAEPSRKRSLASYVAAYPQYETELIAAASAPRPAAEWDVSVARMVDRKKAIGARKFKPNKGTDK